jgi:hypothetical protein
MSSTASFQAYIPLSNWLAGFDRYRQTFDKKRLPRQRFPECFYVLGEDATQAQVQQVLTKTRDLIERLGVPGDKIVRMQCELPVATLPGEEETYASLNTYTGTGIGWRWPHSTLPLSGYGFVNEHDGCLPAPHESITAAAFALPNTQLIAWEDCLPRTFSVLPVAQACNANCAFCFSKASMSDAVIPHKLDLDSVRAWSALARSRGATRAVITGGGEPTLIPSPLMEALIQVIAQDFESILLITNGSRFVQIAQREGDEHMIDVLRGWKRAGLTRIAVSRHGVDAVSDADLMGLEVDGAYALDLIHQAGLSSRLICVMQKGGVETASDVRAFLERAAANGTTQVCFKELYVSSLSENPWAPSRENLYCQANQVPLSMLIEALEGMGFQHTATLPWGSPVYTGCVQGVHMQVAAYTEPSVGWERTTGVVRSWNWMSNSECIASLEDPHSRLALPGALPVQYRRKVIPSRLLGTVDISV